MSKAGRRPARRIRTTKPFRAVAYRAKIRPFDSLKFIDMRALGRARRATIELGTVETRKGTVTVVAHVRNGAIVGLAPKGCAGCAPRKGKIPARAALEAFVGALQRAGLKRLGGPRLPVKITRTMSAARLARLGCVIVDIDLRWFDLCITYIAGDGSICIWCVFAPTVCVDAISGAG